MLAMPCRLEQSYNQIKDGDLETRKTLSISSRERVGGEVLETGDGNNVL